METLILYVEESAHDNGSAINEENKPEIKYSIQGCNTDICRLCLDLSILQPISNCQFVKEFNNFMFIEVQLGVQFPKNACEKCINKLNEIISFLKMCQNSLNVYKKMEENCAKLRTSEIEKEPLEKTEIEPSSFSPKVGESVKIDPLLGIKSADANTEHVIEEIKIEMIASDSIEENTDAKDKSEEITVPKKKDVSNNKTELDVKDNTKQKNVHIPKMCYACGACVTSLAIHYKKSTSCKPKNFKCSLCNLYFVTKHRMLSHQRVSHWDKISAKHFVCQKCSKLFKHSETLKRHLRVHENGKEYMCEICGKSYARQTQLRDHRNIHDQLKPYPCRYCGKCFHAKSYRFSHEIRHKKESFYTSTAMEVPSTEIFVCHICNRKFSNETYLNHHMHSHENDTTTCECKQCKLQFEDVHLYKQHYETHVRKYACPLCEKKLSSSHYLEKHMRGHTIDRRYLCSECGNKFHTSGHLKRHTLLIHNVAEVKPFECNFCKKTFNLKENLLVHERVHTGERPYKCHLCDKDYMESSSRTKHVRKVHGEYEVNNIYN